MKKNVHEPPAALLQKLHDEEAARIEVEKKLEAAEAERDHFRFLLDTYSNDPGRERAIDMITDLLITRRKLSANLLQTRTELKEARAEINALQKKIGRLH